MTQDEIYAMEIAAAALSVATVGDAMPPALRARMLPARRRPRTRA